MKFVLCSKNNGVAKVSLSKGKVNALNETIAEELYDCFSDLETDQEVNSVILTGNGKFFSFGFDVPEFLSCSKDDFTRYLTKFTKLYTYIFLFPKPVIAALNGHTIAGGCMLAIACDYRIMVSEKAKISLNEITFGSSVFAGSVEMLKFCAGSGNAQTILYSGAMYSANQAMNMGLVDKVSSIDNLMSEAEKTALDFAKTDNTAFTSIKRLLRRPPAEDMAKREKESIQEFVDIWYSEKTWEKLKKIKIYS
jgi:Delta3-Delta2-enoyl-CoA isomerase